MRRATIDRLVDGEFTAASINKAARRYPGVSLREMVKEAHALRVELKETLTAIGKTIDDNDPQLAVIDQIVAEL